MSPSPADCAEDWMVLAGRGALDGAEWDTHMRHVSACANCRATWLAVRSFQQLDGIAPADELVVSRVVDAALSVSAVGGLRGRWKGTRRRVAQLSGLRMAVAAAVTMVFMVTVASAGLFIHRRLQPVAASDLPPMIPPPVDRRARPLARRPNSGKPPAVVTLVDEGQISPPVSRSSLLKEADVRPEPHLSASSLFAQATAARQSGRATEAVRLFRRLHREFGSTVEGRVCLISLGDLLEEMFLHDQALGAFEAYLRRSPSGTLAPEALAGKVRTLESLGRGPEAERVYRELRRRYPDSLYAGARGATMSN